MKTRLNVAMVGWSCIYLACADHSTVSCVERLVARECKEECMAKNGKSVGHFALINLLTIVIKELGTNVFHQTRLLSQQKNVVRMASLPVSSISTF